jgi:hypothetical protein
MASSTLEPQFDEHDGCSVNVPFRDGLNAASTPQLLNSSLPDLKVWATYDRTLRPFDPATCDPATDPRLASSQKYGKRSRGVLKDPVKFVQEP